MDKIWAPWRIDYILQSKQAGCFLCDMFQAQDDRTHLLLQRGETCAVVMNRYPYNSGHLMVAPYRHVDSLAGLNADERAEMLNLVIAWMKILGRAMKPGGYNIGVNEGEVAGAGLKDHIHMHLVPRWTGDTNFMPALAEVKVIPESLPMLWDKLHKLLNDK